MSQKILGNLAKGLVFVVSAPAGAGKTTLVRMLVEEFPSVVEESISYTTRELRAGEQAGKDYVFLTKEEFISKVEDGDFLEHAQVFGEWYGTCKKWLQHKLDQGKHIFLVIDTQGALYLQNIGFQAIYIFIAPPSMEALQDRLIKRKTESEAKRQERLSWAQKEMEKSSFYDYQIVNCNLEIAYQVLKSILIAEEHRTKNKNDR